jgi:hypothetical protein
MIHAVTLVQDCYDNLICCYTSASNLDPNANADTNSNPDPNPDSDSV